MTEVELMPGEEATPPSGEERAEQLEPNPKTKEGVSYESSENRKPDWLPEKFYKDGKPQIESLAKSYGELETAFRRRKDEIAAEVREELTDTTKRPESPDKYELPDLKDMGVIQEELAEHPMVEWFRDFAHERGMSNDDFAVAVKQYVGNMASEQPNYEAEVAKLGDDGPQRIEYVKNWVQANVTDEAERQLYEDTAKTADGFKRVEQLIRRKGAKIPDLEDPMPSGEKSYAEIQSLMQSPAYYDTNRRDPAVVEEVTKWFERNAGKLNK